MGTVPVVTMAQSDANWRNTPHSRGSHAFTHTLTSTAVTTTLCEAPAQLVHNLEGIDFLF